MTVLFRCLIAEALKLRRTPALLLALTAPYVVVLFFAIALFYSSETILRSPGVSAWGWLVETTTVTWSFVFLPTVVALLTALVAATEHGASGFSYLFALGVPRSAIYAAKQLATLGLVALSFGVLGVGVVLAGLILRWLSPEIGFDAAAPLGGLASLLISQLAAASFIVALHTWIALVRPDFALPIAVGFLGTVALVALRAVDADLVPYLPWSYPVEAARAEALTVDGWRWSLAGMGGGLVLAMAAGWSFIRRDVR